MSTCTNCGRDLNEHPVNEQPLCFRFSFEPGGDHRSVCTHIGGHKEWCFGIYYKDGMPCARQGNLKYKGTLSLDPPHTRIVEH